MHFVNRKHKIEKYTCKKKLGIIENKVTYLSKTETVFLIY